MAEPSPVDVPLTLAAAVVLPSAEVVFADAAPDAEASLPLVVSVALAVTLTGAAPLLGMVKVPVMTLPGPVQAAGSLSV